MAYAPEAVNRYLFVYGTLLSSAGHPMGERLSREARLIGPASVEGRLYRIDWYPGLVEAAAPGERAYGELYALDDAAASLAWLDAYEGLVPGSPHHGEYARAERAVRLSDGTERVAWTYLYLGDTGRLTPVRGGRWLIRAE